MIIEDTYWRIDDGDLVIGITISGDTTAWAIPLALLGDAIKEAQEARKPAQIPEASKVEET